MTEFVVERTITFHITTRSARATSFVLEIGASLVQYRHFDKISIFVYHTKRLQVFDPLVAQSNDCIQTNISGS